MLAGKQSFHILKYIKKVLTLRVIVFILITCTYSIHMKHKKVDASQKKISLQILKYIKKVLKLRVMAFILMTCTYSIHMKNTIIAVILVCIV